MKRFLLSLTLLLTTAGIAFAQSGSINKIWLEHGAVRDGKKGMYIHLEIQLSGFKGVQLKAIAYIEIPKNVGHKDTNGRYCTTGGDVCTSKNLTPRYDDSIYEDTRLFIPNSELHLKEGKHTYYCIVQVQGPNGFYISSDYVSFDGTGSANNNARNSHLVPAANTMPDDVNRYICYKDEKGRVASVRTSINNGDWKATVYDGATGNVYGFTRQYVDDTKWVFKGGIPGIYSSNSNVILHIALDWSYINVNGAIYDIPISKQEYDVLIPKVKGYSGNGGGYNSGSSSNSHYHNHEGSSHRDERCKYCGGGGGCSSCNGTGWKYNPYSGYHDKCPSCNGSGRCFNCHGTGKQAIY